MALRRLLRPTAAFTRSRRRHQMEEARSRTEKPRGRPAKSLNGQFMEFEYVPSRYDLADELRTKARLEDEAKRQQIGGGTDFRYPGAKAAAKYEDPFAPDPASEVGTYRYMPDPYDAAKEVERRQRWLREADDLREPFKPTGRVAEPTPSRADLPSIIRAYHALLVRDWEDARFSVIGAPAAVAVPCFLGTALRANTCSRLPACVFVCLSQPLRTTTSYFASRKSPWTRARVCART